MPAASRRSSLRRFRSLLGPIKRGRCGTLRAQDGRRSAWIASEVQIRYERLSDDGQVEKFKRAIDITLIDPACGTMHFAQYAFGLFHRMYLDEIPDARENQGARTSRLTGPSLAVRSTATGQTRAPAIPAEMGPGETGGDMRFGTGSRRST
jgi:hypothetical protein